MGIRATSLCLLACHLSVEAAAAQNCKPDVSTQDKISKQQVDVWRQSLWSTSFMGSVVGPSESEITATIGRYGDFNAVTLLIQKKEESATNAAFEDRWRGAEGSPFYFGFKDGEPLAFVVSEVSNAAQVKQGVFAARGVTTVVLVAAISDQDLLTMKNTLTSRQIDAVRIRLAGGAQIDKSVDDGNGAKAKAKFVCFFDAMDKRGAFANSPSAQMAAASAGVDFASVAGKYIRKDKQDDFIDLDPTGQLTLQQEGRTTTGQYTISGEVLTILLSTRRTTEKVRLADNRIVDNGGTIWERTSGGSSTARKPITVEQVLQMVAAKLPDDVIITSIQNSGTRFDMAPEVLIKLKSAGASDAVIRAMTKSGQ